MTSDDHAKMPSHSLGGHAAPAHPIRHAIALGGDYRQELKDFLQREAQRSGATLQLLEMPRLDGLTADALEPLFACSAAIAGIAANGCSDSEISRFVLLMAQFGIRRAVLAIVPGEGARVEAADVEDLSAAMRAHGDRLDFDSLDVIVLDRSAGAGLALPGGYAGPAIMDLLDAAGDIPVPEDEPLRLLVNETVAPGDRLIGTLVAGRIAPGDTAVLLPGAVSTQITAVAAPPGMTRGGALDIMLARMAPVPVGAILAAPGDRPEVADQMAVHLIWTSDTPLLPSRRYAASLRQGLVNVQVSTLKHKVNPETLEHIATDTLIRGDLGYCNLSFDQAIPFDPFEKCAATGRLTIIDRETGTPVGVVLIAHALRRATNIHWQALAVDRDARASLKGQRPCCLWFTGLSGSGKSTVASLLEKRLQSLGRHTYTLDGDNVRHGLNRDLGFTDTDRVENVRRVAEVSKLFVDAGLIVMCSFISPFRAERRLARDLFGADEFLEIFVNTPLEICEQRDIKGLYKKARAGELKNFTGIDSPYEAPEHAEIALDGGTHRAEDMVEQVLAELQRRSMV